MKMLPYADFAFWTNFHLRFMRNVKFMNHVTQPAGTMKTLEVPGPADFDSCYSSWRVFVNTL